MADLELSGTYTALATPFTADGSAIDWASWEKLVAAQIEGGVAGVIPCGTTGESATLSDAEDRELVTLMTPFAPTLMSGKVSGSSPESTVTRSRA